MDSLDKKSIDSFLRLAGQSGYSSSLFVNTSNHHTAEHGDSSEGALAQQQGGEPIINAEDEGSGKKRKLNAALKNEPDNDCINEEEGEPIDWLDASNPEKKRFGNTKGSVKKKWFKPATMSKDCGFGQDCGEDNEWKADVRGRSAFKNRSTIEEEKIRLILRSNGQPFPSNTEDNDPSYVVCLAHHVDKDLFILLAFNATTMPCRLVRFNRDGEVVESNTETNKFTWSKVDAAVMVAAVNKCRDSGCAYFVTDATESGCSNNCSNERNMGKNMKSEEANGDDMCDGDEASDTCLREKYMSFGEGDCLCLVPMNQRVKVTLNYASDEQEEMCDEEDSDYELSDDELSDDEGYTDKVEMKEYKAIRSVILNELLGNGSGGVNNFRHPDSNFLLPLSRSISKELKRWRYLCNHVPAKSDWPDLPSVSESERDEIINEKDEDEDDDKMSDQEKREFDEIVSKRNSQIAESVEHCQSCMMKMESLLRTLTETNNPTVISYSSYELCKEGVAALATLEHMQQNYPIRWLDCHETLRDFETTCYDASDNIKDSLMTWLDEQEEGKEDTVEMEEDDGYSDVAKKLIDVWLKDDKTLLKTLSNVVTTIEQCIQAGQQSLQKALDCIESEYATVSLLKKDSERITELNVARLVKLWNMPWSDDEEEEVVEEEQTWHQDALSPGWSKDDLESHLSFGWCISEHEESLVMSFIVDHVTLTTSLTKCLTSTNGSGLMSSQSQFNSFWSKKIQPIIDNTVGSIESFLESGDLRNASIMLICCLRVFCDKDIWLNVRSRYNDYDGSSVSNEDTTSKFLEACRTYDSYAVKVALAYFDTEFPQREAGGHFFLDALRSGFMYAPYDASDVHWEKVKSRRLSGNLSVWWDRYSHPAASVFLDHGWQHPTLLHIRGGTGEENQLISALAIMEAPIVIKERFNIMKELGRTRDAITFARVAGGGNECIHFLLTEGFVDEAMVQASISKNVEGLSQLSKDLVSTNPCASVLCIHAHIIGVMEGLESQNCHKFPQEGIDNLVDILGGKWFKPPGNEKFTSLAIQERHGADRLDVPSLHLLSIVSLAEAMLRAAKSTSEMQAILEQQHFAECGISPLLATIAITARATSPKANVGTLDASLKHLLGSSGLRILAVDDGHGGVSGWLTRFGLIPKALGEKDYLELVCFLYKSARFLIEKGCGSQFCFTLALFSSVQIGVMTGYESVAMDMIGSVLQFEEDGSSMSPLSILSVCYTALFTRCGYDVCQNIQCALLETFLCAKVKLSGSYLWRQTFNEDILGPRVWVAIAFMRHQGVEGAAIALVNNIVSYQSKDSDKLDSVIVKTLVSLSEVCKERSELPDAGTMAAYATSLKRDDVTKLQRDEMISVFISHVLETAPFLASATIATMIRRHRMIDPLVFNRGLDELETRLSNISGLTLALSKKSSLFTTCTIMHYVQENPYTVLELGLGWLRSALSRDGLVQFDNSEEIGESRCQNLSRLFHSSDWWGDINTMRQGNRCVLEGKPKLAAKALAAILETKVAGIQDEAQQISYLCHEAIVSCRVLIFLLEPTPACLSAVVGAWNESELRGGQLPLFLHPNHLASMVVEPEWSLRPDFSAKPRICEEEEAPSIPFLDDRAAIAVQYGHINEAANLCIMALNNKFWTKLSDKSKHDGLSMRITTEAWRVLQACLYVIEGAITSREKLPDNFVNHALHMVLTMNWLRACTKCSPGSPFVTKHDTQLLVSVDSVVKLHEIALAWNETMDGNKCLFGPSLTHCLNVIRCISRCIYVLEEDDHEICGECSYREKLTEEHIEKGHAKEQKQRKRQSRDVKSDKTLDSQLCGNVESDFEELEKYASQLHMKEISFWCKDAIRRLRNRASTKKQNRAKNTKKN